MSAFIALPLLPERSLQGSIVMALNPDQGETVGWPRFVDTVATGLAADPAGRAPADGDLHRQLRRGRARSTCSARAHGLPRAYSGHNGFSEWGRPPAQPTPARCWSATTGLRTPRRTFTGCRRLATIDNGVGLDNDEQGLPLLLCRPSASWAALWPRLTHFN